MTAPAGIRRQAGQPEQAGQPVRSDRELTTPATRPPDTGNRAFWVMVTLAAAGRLVIMLGACCLTMVIVRRVVAAGVSVLWASWPSLLPGEALLAVTGAGLAVGLWSLARSAWHTVAFTRQVRRRRAPIPALLAEQAGRAGVARGRLVVIGAAAPFALTYGVLRPRVLVSTGLAEVLAGGELAAVLTHEQEHVRGRDPVKAVVARALPARYFYVPYLARLRARYIAGRELAADRAAIAACGRAPLAGALLTVSGGPAWAAAAPAAAMAGHTLLGARVSQLETGTEPPVPPAGRRVIAASFAAVALTAAAIAWSAVIVWFYLPMCVAR
jgi:Zn-dependent protease with chaperone function